MMAPLILNRLAADSGLNFQSENMGNLVRNRSVAV